MSSEMGAKYIYCNIAQEHKLHNAIIVTLEGTEIIKTEKKKGQQNSLKNTSFTNAVRQWQQSLKLLLNFN